jgi:uncharacterized protein (DUF4415 family)
MEVLMVEPIRSATGDETQDMQSLKPEIIPHDHSSPFMPWITLEAIAGTRGGCIRRHMKREDDFSGAKRWPVMPAPKGKTRLTIRLDEDVIAWFRDQVEKAGGGNYQSLINQALREHVPRSREPLEATLRRVIREETRRTS